jgi:membrane protease subunit (stomatin/prohibitin family)
MGIADFIKGQFIDVISHVDENDKLLVYKYHRYGNEIKQGSSLIVRNGQAAVFVYKGQISDIFQPGNYTLNTQNLPILSSLRAFTNLFNSPIKSDLYFINTTQFISNRFRNKRIKKL